MGRSELVAKILSDGQARAAAIRAESARRRTEIESRTQAELDRLQAEAGEKTRHEAGMILERARSAARLARRNRLLAAKWTVLEQVAETARQRLLAAAWYPELVRGIIRRYATDGAEVRLSAADTENLGSGLPPGVRLGEPAPIDGGAIVRVGREELNFALGDRLTSVRDQLISDLSRTLFTE
jgi:vacuolar-type H+-ATPase subunit E/Vma4